MLKRVSFDEKSKVERDIIPGQILGDIIDMQINGIYVDRIQHRSGKDLFNTLGRKDKREVILLLKLLIKNMQHVLKDIGTIETKKSLPICPSGQSGKFINLEFLPQCIRLRDILEANF